MFSREPNAREGRGKYACNFGLSTRRMNKMANSTGRRRWLARSKPTSCYRQRRKNCYSCAVLPT